MKCRLISTTGQCALQAENEQLQKEATRCRQEALEAFERVEELKRIIERLKNGSK